MTQCNSILYGSDGKIIEQCQWGLGHDGEHVYFINQGESNNNLNENNGNDLK